MAPPWRLLQRVGTRSWSFVALWAGDAFRGAGLGHPPGAYGLVATRAVFAAAARAPITAVLIIFELTGDYAIVLPLMLAVAVATGLLSRDTIYTLQLRRRNIDLETRRRAATRRHCPSSTTAATASKPLRACSSRARIRACR
jgi:H+/Cl- antiporter ClcA